MLISARRVLVDAGEYLDDGAVLIEGDSIAAVGPRKEIEEQAAADVPRSVFDGTLLPGLIDAHVHLVFDGSPDPVSALQDSTDEALLAVMRRRAEELLLSGVTTARDLGDRNGLALRLDAEIADQRTPGPRIVSAGTPLTTPGGHCHFLGGEVSGEAEIRALIRVNLDRGAGVTKCMVTGGGLTRAGPQVTNPSSLQRNCDFSWMRLTRQASPSRPTRTEPTASSQPWRPEWTPSSTARG